MERNGERGSVGAERRARERWSGTTSEGAVERNDERGSGGAERRARRWLERSIAPTLCRSNALSLQRSNALLAESFEANNEDTDELLGLIKQLVKAISMSHCVL
ncbi:MAG: hypothetical protein H0T73_17130 [Ardenticatenales bacterium]|nr:hypothetical protein [Ardenticatenales bacterium]